MFSKLFVKIFLGFWLATSLALGSWMLSARYLEDVPRFSGQEKPRDPPHRFMLRLAYALQNEPLSRFEEMLRAPRERYGIEIYVVNSDDEELFGRTLPPVADRVLKRLETSVRRATVKTPQGQLMGLKLFRPDEGVLRTVIIPPKPASPLVETLSASTGLRLTLAVGITGLVCYLLSRLMTNRLKDLQLASRRLARGELDARIAVREHGGDETDELARDFNSMAGQIETQIETRERLLRDVSHELRSPLARLRLALALAQDGDKLDATYLERIEHEAERLEELIAQLLHTPPGEAPLDDHLDLVALLRELCADSNFEAREAGKRVRLSTHLDDAPVATQGDQLKQAFENILRNAVKYTAPDTEVVATLLDKPSHYELLVEDHGPGVDEADLEHLFTEFYRSDTARQRETGGYGLGLAIARRAVEHHGGTIRAENTGAGLRIIVQLPRSPEDVTAV